jgi:hypothetical protein
LSFFDEFASDLLAPRGHNAKRTGFVAQLLNILYILDIRVEFKYVKVKRTSNKKAQHFAPQTNKWQKNQPTKMLLDLMIRI